MNKVIAYSSINLLADDVYARCCGEQMSSCPECDADLCVFCMSACDSCGGRIDWTK